MLHQWALITKNCSINIHGFFLVGKICCAKISLWCIFFIILFEFDWCCRIFPHRKFTESFWASFGGWNLCKFWINVASGCDVCNLFYFFDDFQEWNLNFPDVFDSFHRYFHQPERFWCSIPCLSLILLGSSCTAWVKCRTTLWKLVSVVLSRWFWKWHDKIKFQSPQKHCRHSCLPGSLWTSPTVDSRMINVFTAVIVYK